MKDTPKKLSVKEVPPQEEKNEESVVDQAVDSVETNENVKETTSDDSKMKHQRDQVKNSQKSTSLSMYIILSLMVAVMGYLVNQQMIINQYNKNLESKLAKLENPQLEFKMVSKVGLGDIFVECPASFTLLSCGINHSDNGHNTGHRPFSTTGCICSQNADETNLHLKYTCFAYCMKNPSLHQSKTKPYPLSIE